MLFLNLINLGRKIVKIKEYRQGERSPGFPKSFVLSITPRIKLLILLIFKFFKVE